MVSGASHATLSGRWKGVGRTQGVALDSIELWTVELPFRDPVRTARGAHRTRPILLIGVVGRTLDGNGTRIDGWGECAALADTTFDAEDVTRSLAVLGDDLVPALVERSRRDRGLLPPPSDLQDVRRASPRSPLAFAALEMAVADAHLRAEQRSLASLLGVEGRVVEPGAVVGQADTTDQLLASVGELAEQGYSRVKLKIGPGWDLEPVATVASAFPGLRLQVDANGSYRPEDGAHLAELDRFGLLCLEQPFERSDLAAHVRPGRPDGHADLPRREPRLPACRGAGPGHGGVFGGLRQAVPTGGPRRGPLGRRAVRRIRGATLDGGHVRVGLRPGVNTVLGALDGMTWPGDLSPSRELPRGRSGPRSPRSPPGAHGVHGVRAGPPTRDRPRPVLLASLPPGPGMGPPPGPDALTRFGTSHQVIGGPGG